LRGISFFLRGEEVLLPGHVVLVIFIQLPAKEKLEVFTIGWGFVIL
jgi:hypothetical protein